MVRTQVGKLRIKYSEITAAPIELAPGELAYSHESELLFIGTSQGIVVIGGRAFLPNLNTNPLTVERLQVTSNTAAAWITGGCATFAGDIGVSGRVWANGARFVDAVWMYATPGTPVEIINASGATGNNSIRLALWNGSSVTEALRAHESGGVSIGTPTNPGAGNLKVQGQIEAGMFRCAQYTVATVPSAIANVGGMIYVSNESGGATLAFSDGSNWRRVHDRESIS